MLILPIQFGFKSIDDKSNKDFLYKVGVLRKVNTKQPEYVIKCIENKQLKEYVFVGTYISIESKLFCMDVKKKSSNSVSNNLIADFYNKAVTFEYSHCNVIKDIDASMDDVSILEPVENSVKVEEIDGTTKIDLSTNLKLSSNSIDVVIPDLISNQGCSQLADKSVKCIQKTFSHSYIDDHGEDEEDAECVLNQSNLSAGTDATVDYDSDEYYVPKPTKSRRQTTLPKTKQMMDDSGAVVRSRETVARKTKSKAEALLLASMRQQEEDDEEVEANELHDDGLVVDLTVDEEVSKTKSTPVKEKVTRARTSKNTPKSETALKLSSAQTSGQKRKLNANNSTSKRKNVSKDRELQDVTNISDAESSFSQSQSESRVQSPYGDIHSPMNSSRRSSRSTRASRISYTQYLNSDDEDADEDDVFSD